MLRVLILNIFLLSSSYGSILISSFDPFDGEKGNNSQTVARKLVMQLQNSFPGTEIKLCELRTVYDKSFASLKSCYHSMQTKPRLILSLGESGCKKLKIETRAFNWDYDYSSDNDGVHREGSLISLCAKQYLPMSLNWAQGYCSLSNYEKKKLIIDNNTGTFVCNNLSYQMREEFPRSVFSFAHVPSYGCARQNAVTLAQSILYKLVSNIYKSNNIGFIQPVSSVEVRDLSKANSCIGTFYKKLLRKY